MTPRNFFFSPLVHFFVIGALIFVCYGVVEDDATAPALDAIVLTETDADRLVQNFTATWNRAPTATELDHLMRSWALEEVNVREALALGLDRGDAVIRQRLHQKMRYLAESGAATLEPDDVTLQAYLDNNADRFTRSARFTFEHIILPPESEASEVLALLDRGADPWTLGAASLLPPSLSMSPAPVIGRTFGDGFHVALEDMPIGEWHGPVQSGYGLHLVRVIDREDAALPPLREIRDRVRAEWLAERMKEMSEAFGQALLDRYPVSLPDADTVLSQ